MSSYPDYIPSVDSLDGVPPEQIAEMVAGRTEPLLFKGSVAQWPMVQAAQTGALSDYLAPFDQGRPLVVFRAPASAEGRIFYNDAMDGFNFERGAGQLTTTLRELEGGIADGSCRYVGSTSMDHFLTGVRDHNDLPIPGEQPLVSLWFGNKTRIAAHFDLPQNLACVVAGRRRFTLFPPEQVANLYPGPVDFTPAGQAISMVDFYDPDHDRFPRYQEALNAASVANMEPGDVLFLPSMWWHQVEGLDAVNALVNYWWRDTPAWTGLPHDALMHSLLAIGALPAAQRKAWGELFDHYVVNREEATAHIPEARRGPLGKIDHGLATKLRQFLAGKLQRG